MSILIIFEVFIIIFDNLINRVIILLFSIVLSLFCILISISIFINMLIGLTGIRTQVRGFKVLGAKPLHYKTTWGPLGIEPRTSRKFDTN